MTGRNPKPEEKKNQDTILSANKKSSALPGFFIGKFGLRHQELPSKFLQKNPG
jgi:hypothetical protein